MILLDELENSGFLRHFSPPYWPVVASVAQLKEYAAGACIFSEGDSARQIYLVLQGSVGLEVRVPDSGPVQSHQLGRGDLLGWSPVLGHGPLTATARALTACRLAALDSERIRILSERDAQFGSELLRATAEALAERLRAMRVRLPDGGRHELHAMKEGAD
jgi:CRP-like cAMP-binding protein